MYSAIEVGLILLSLAGQFLPEEWRAYGQAVSVLSAIGALCTLYASGKKDRKLSEWKDSVARSLVKGGNPNPLIDEIQSDMRKNGGLKDVEGRYRKVLEIEPGNLDAIENVLISVALSVNHQLRIFGQPTDARISAANEILSTSLRIKNKLSDKGLLGLAILHDGLHEHKHARRIYDELLRRRPEDSSILSYASTSHLMSGDVAGAYALIKRATDRGIGNALEHFNLAEAEYAMGHFRAAIQLHKTVPKTLGARHSLSRIAESYFMKGDFLQAVFYQFRFIVQGRACSGRAFREFALFVFLSFAFCWRSFLCLTLGRLPYLGRLYLRRQVPLNFLATLCDKQLRDFPDPFVYTAETARIMTFLDPLNADYKRCYGVLLAKLGRKAEAIEVLEQLLEETRSAEVQEIVDSFKRMTSEELMKLEVLPRK